MNSTVNGLVHAVRKRSQKVPHAKVGHSGLLGLIPMIQPPFCTSCDALQYETGTAKNCMHWNVAPYALPGSVRFVHVLDRWRNDCKVKINKQLVV